ncbi:MAG: hypothetical protein KDE53_23495 [Caldilineaceae bacterium]|nr:hypothetical protein [Caldilineaceae bacterium]
MSTHNFASWRKRGSALFRVIDHQIAAMRNSSETVSRKETLIALLTALRTFGEGQLEFFIRGFEPTNRLIRLEPSTAYPPEYAMRATVDQIAYDLDVIQRAYQQRLPTQASSEMRTLLAKTDYLAYQALKPAIERKLIDDVTVITYFQKATNVRIIPYAPVALIGLPISALAVPKDLLAIPHEVGHYVFRHGCTQRGSSAGSRFDAALRQQFSDLPKWVLAWLEEIFADVYGAAVGGPVMALGIEELITDDPYADFTRDDGEHPIPALRPDIYHSALQKQGSHGRELKLLVDRWEEYCTKRGKPEQFTPQGVKDDVSLKEAKGHLDSVIRALLDDDLGGLRANTALWSGSVDHEDRIESLFTDFADRLGKLTVDEANLAPELDVVPRASTRSLSTASEDSSPESTSHKSPKEVLELHLRPLRSQSTAGPAPVHDMGGSGTPPARRVGETGQWFDALKRDGARGIAVNIPPTVWMALLEGSGWATEGPGGAHAH